MTQSQTTASTPGWLAGMLRTLPGDATGLLWFSLAANLLLLVSPLYMLQIYDRILTSGSRDTLIWLSAIAVFLLAVYGAAEAGRRRISALAADALERRFAPRMFTRFDREGGASVLSSRQDSVDLVRAQTPLQNGSLLAFLDLPFSPFFIALLFLVHPALGALSLGGAVVILAVALMAERTTRRPGAEAAAAAAAANDFIRGIARQRSAVVAMGLLPKLYERWRGARDAASAHGLEAATGDGGFSALARSVRQILQVLVLGAGAGLALTQEISPGGIVAASIITSRALAPIDQIVGSWRGIVQARDAWAGLTERLSGEAASPRAFTAMPPPAAALRLDRLAIAAPGAEAPLVRPFSYEAVGGKAIALIGGNGAGKTTLLQTIAGAWPPASGNVTLGGRDIHDWPSADRGAHVGYVPQDVELAPGTVAENIARFEAGRDADTFAAAKAAGAHETILGLPSGYDTLVGPGGLALSAGQRQMIGLARALFGDPALLLLDEPTANLDTAAADLMISALIARAGEGALVIAATHDLRLVQKMDVVLSIRRGAVMATPASEFGAAPKAGSKGLRVEGTGS